MGNGIGVSVGISAAGQSSGMVCVPPTMTWVPELSVWTTTGVSDIVTV